MAYSACVNASSGSGVCAFAARLVIPIVCETCCWVCKGNQQLSQRPAFHPTGHAFTAHQATRPHPAQNTLTSCTWHRSQLNSVRFPALPLKRISSPQLWRGLLGEAGRGRTAASWAGMVIQRAYAAPAGSIVSSAPQLSHLQAGPWSAGTVVVTPDRMHFVTGCGWQLGAHGRASTPT